MSVFLLIFRIYLLLVTTCNLICLTEKKPKNFPTSITHDLSHSETLRSSPYHSRRFWHIHPITSVVSGLFTLSQPSFLAYSLYHSRHFWLQYSPYLSRRFWLIHPISAVVSESSPYHSRRFWLITLSQPSFLAYSVTDP